MGTSRLDDFSDSAWLLVAAVTIIVLVERILNTLEKLMQACKCQPTQSLRITHAAIMVLVGVSAATIAIPDKWVQSIVQAMFVGVGFALKEVLSEVLAGLSVMQMQDAAKGGRVLFKDSKEEYVIEQANLMSVTLEQDGQIWHVPWTKLQSQWICLNA